MDYVLMVTTLLVNMGLGWSRGAGWMWLLHAANAGLWIAYTLQTGQMGFVWLSVVTLILDLVSAGKVYYGRKFATVWLKPHRGFRRTYRMGQERDRFYGAAYADPMNMVVVAYPIPINLIVRAYRTIEHELTRLRRDRYEAELDEAYLRGRREELANSYEG